MSTITIPASRGLTVTAVTKLPRWSWAALALLLVAGLGAWALTRAHASDDLITAPVTQATLVSSVTASGTVNPQNLISVGTQVSGTIAAIDVDYNSKVKRGQVLARLDPSTFAAQLAQAQAALAQARAQVAQAAATAHGADSGVEAASATANAEAAAITAANANVAKTQAALTLAQKTATRDTALLSQGYIAQSTVDTDRAASRKTRATWRRRRPPSRRPARRTLPATPPSARIVDRAEPSRQHGSRASQRGGGRGRRAPGRTQSAAHRDYVAGRRHRGGARRLGRPDGRGVATDAHAVLDRAESRQDGSRHQRRRNPTSAT